MAKSEAERLCWDEVRSRGRARGVPPRIRERERVGDDVGATIVLAEDEKDLRRVYAECLRRWGHTVWEAADGAEAAALVRAHQPDLLLLDLWMPILNGLEVLEQLRDSREAMATKIVMLTHQRDAEYRLEGFALGVAAYWTKDLSLADLGERIEAVLGAPRPPDRPDQQRP